MLVPESDGDVAARTTGGHLVRRGLLLVLTLLAGVLAVGIGVLPMALERGLERATVHETIGVVPATLTFTGTSDSDLSLGILGALRLPVSRGPIGISAAVDGPPPITVAGQGLGSYFSRQMLHVYAGLFHDPDVAVRGYVEELTRAYRHEVVAADLVYALPGGLLVGAFAWWFGVPPRSGGVRRRLAVVAVGVCAAVLLTSCAAWWEFEDWPAAHHRSSDVYALPSLDGTPVAGAVTDSLLLEIAIEDGYPRIHALIQRQQERTAAYVSGARSQLTAARGEMAGPAADEDAVMMQSDMHCNSAMTTLQTLVVSLLNQKYGEAAVALLGVSGDLTTNGTAAERECVRQEADVAQGAPVAAVTGNHDSELTARQMADAGMHVLDGRTVTLAGIKVLGQGDPERTEMFGPTRPRGDATEASVGEATYRTALEEHPDLVLLHEGYAVERFVGSGVGDMRVFLEGRGSATVPWEDGVRDLPASAVFYGHWHRSVAPRVVWNSDGGWTLVMELNTSGGAVAAPTLNHFSTPWSGPQQLASFPVIFRNRDTGLVTGYQIYSFAPGGEVRIEPRVSVGAAIPSSSR